MNKILIITFLGIFSCIFASDTEDAQEDISSHKRSSVVSESSRWTAEEDRRLTEAVDRYGITKWAVIAGHIPDKIGKQCRERWVNYLDPSVDKTPLSPQEKDHLDELVRSEGTKWSKFTQYFPGSTDNKLKNAYNSRQRTKQHAGLADGEYLVPQRKRSKTAPTLQGAATGIDDHAASVAMAPLYLIVSPTLPPTANPLMTVPASPSSHFDIPSRSIPSQISRPSLTLSGSFGSEPSSLRLPSVERSKPGPKPKMMGTKSKGTEKKKSYRNWTTEEQDAFPTLISEYTLDNGSINWKGMAADPRAHRHPRALRAHLEHLQKKGSLPPSQISSSSTFLGKQTRERTLNPDQGRGELRYVPRGTISRPRHSLEQVSKAEDSSDDASIKSNTQSSAASKKRKHSKKPAKHLSSKPSQSSTAAFTSSLAASSAVHDNSEESEESESFFEALSPGIEETPFVELFDGPPGSPHDRDSPQPWSSSLMLPSPASTPPSLLLLHDGPISTSYNAAFSPAGMNTFSLSTNYLSFPNGSPRAMFSPSPLEICLNGVNITF